jgi:hypothetical protein
MLADTCSLTNANQPRDLHVTDFSLWVPGSCFVHLASRANCPPNSSFPSFLYLFERRRRHATLSHGPEINIKVASKSRLESFLNL